MSPSNKESWLSCHLFILAIALFTASAQAHPLSQGALDVTIGPDKIVVHAQVTPEEVAVTNSATGANPLPGPWAAAGISAYEQHAEYLTSHLHFNADGKPLSGRVLGAMPPQDATSTTNAFAHYEIEYPLPAPGPRMIGLWQDVLADGHFAAGGSWEATYIVNIGQGGKAAATAGLLLTRMQPIGYVCDWNRDASSPDPLAHVNKRQLCKDYFVHGVHHILTGYDHLLFISALVLAAASLWDLVKVVTAFTLAHTLTLTLAALNLIPVSERIAEPLIAASIIFVALQNVFWPRQTRGWLRLGTAFFFGLFHGLGFAGGLLDAMHGMRGSNVLLAILAFSLGVEVGHQFIVLPLFTGLKISRQTRRPGIPRERFFLATQRFGSALISLAGLWFLVTALKMSLRGVGQ